uniref:Uncharacterized protein n=1 Tax=Panagrolaimus davidi TaxID=227884 RepID=A0A914PYI0_9BILA
MKSGCLFSICAFLLIIQRVSATCTTNVGGKPKTCPAYCASYTFPGLKHIKTACPEDFKPDCKVQTESIKFINSKNSYDLEYVSIKDSVEYISGCSDAGAQGKPYGDSATETTAKPSDSGLSEQNGALTLIGILAFGWMLLSAAWIH